MLATWGCTTFPKATLDLQLAGATSLDSRVTFTRGSTATYFNSAGVLTTANNDVARFDYDPSTLAARGLLIEEARTNSIRNNTMQGAVAGTPGTAPTNWGISTTSGELSSSVVGTGTESGITYIDVRINGTVTAARELNINFEGTGAIAATSGQTWTESIYLRQVAGSQSNIATIHLQGNTYTAALAYVNSPWFTTRTVTTAPLSTQRLEASGTLSGATIAFVTPFIKVTTAASGAVDFTLRIGLPQLELGAFATSVIPTTTTALTRSADVASMTGTNFSSWFNQNEGTLFVEAATAAAADTFVFADINSGATNNYIRQSTSSAGTTMQLVVQVLGSTTAAPGVAVTLGSVRKAAGAYKVDSVQQAVNGTLGTEDTTAAIPANMSQMNLGSRAGSANDTQIWLARIAYYPTRLPNATLQALTA